MVSFGFSLSTRAVAIGRIRSRELVELAEEAEASGGVDSIWVGDSIVAKPRLEAVTILSAIAARTTRVKLGTACLATFPLRHPVLFAHQWASLDEISDGRSLLCVCLGGHGPQDLVENEFAAFSATMKERVPRMLEAMDIVRRLWTEDDVSHEGKFWQLDGVTVGPKPIQNPCPIWIANNPPPDPVIMERAYRRAARHGDGWMSGSLSPQVFAERWQMVRAYREEEKGTADGFLSSMHLRSNVNDDREAAFRDAKEFLDLYYSVDTQRTHLETECVVGTVDECVEKYVAYAKGGCDVIMIRLLGWEPRQQMERWIRDVIPAVKKRLEVEVEAPALTPG